MNTVSLFWTYMEFPSNIGTPWKRFTPFCCWQLGLLLFILNWRRDKDRRHRTNRNHFDLECRGKPLRQRIYLHSAPAVVQPKSRPQNNIRAEPATLALRSRLLQQFHWLVCYRWSWSLLAIHFILLMLPPIHSVWNHTVLARYPITIIS